MISVNPVLAREVRERMRTGRAFVVLGAFLGVLILTVYVVYQGAGPTGDPSGIDLGRQTRLGRDLYEWVLFVMLGLVLFFVPGLTAGAIAGERERQTLVPLQVTLLRPRNILVGKVLAAMSFLVLLFVASLPVIVIAYLLGGIRLLDGAKGLGIVCLVALLLTIIVAAVSALARRVQTATLAAYGITAVLVLVGPVIFLTLAVADGSEGLDVENPPAFLVVINPLSIVADATAGQEVTGSSGTALGEVRRGILEAKSNNADSWFAWFPDEDLGARFRIIDGERTGLPAWVLGTAALALVAALMSFAAVRRLRTPSESER